MTFVGTRDFRSLPWYRQAALIALIPFVLPAVPLVLLVMACFGFYAIGALWIGEFRVRRLMRRRGRCLTSTEARRRIAAGGGTLLIEHPTFGWRIARVWWTADDLLAVSPFAIPTDEEYAAATATQACLDWDRWCWENYTRLDHGRALLIRGGHGASIERRFQELFPNVAVVHAWTAFVPGRRCSDAPEAGSA